MSTAPARTRSLGLWRATSLVTGNIVGSGLFMLPAALGVFGPLGLVGWGLTAIGSIFLSLVFARLSSLYPKIGGPYAYSREAFGDFIGFQMSWAFWVGTWASNAAIATTFVSYLSVFFPELKTNMLMAFTVSISAVWGLTFVNCTGVRNAAIVQLVTTVLKVIPLVAIGVFGLFYVNPEHFAELNPSGEPLIPSLGMAAALTLFSFLGLESATIPADDVENPERTIPIATILGTVISAIIYIGTMISILGVIPAQELSQSAAPFADAARVIFGEWAVPLIAISALIATFGTLNGWILVQAQVPLAAAQDGLFPSAFKKVTKSGTPYLGLIFSSALMTIMLLMNYQAGLTEQFTAIVIFSTFAVLLPYLYSSVADLYFLFKDPDSMPRARWMRSVIIAGLAFCYTIVIAMGAGQDAVYMGMVFVFMGFPVYAWLKRAGKVSRKSV